MCSRASFFAFLVYLNKEKSSRSQGGLSLTNLFIYFLLFIFGYSWCCIITTIIYIYIYIYIYLSVFLGYEIMVSEHDNMNTLENSNTMQ